MVNSLRLKSFFSSTATGLLLIFCVGSSIASAEGLAETASVNQISESANKSSAEPVAISKWKTQIGYSKYSDANIERSNGMTLAVHRSLGNTFSLNAGFSSVQMSFKDSNVELLGSNMNRTEESLNVGLEAQAIRYKAISFGVTAGYNFAMELLGNNTLYNDKEVLAHIQYGVAAEYAFNQDIGARLDTKFENNARSLVTISAIGYY